MKGIKIISAVLLVFSIAISINAQNDPRWLNFEPESKQSNGKHVVLISGDEEYRSEEGMPMLAKILTHHHGFKTTVLFSIDESSGEINPNHQTNIPGMHHLKSADLVIMLIRFRELPKEQMDYFADYLKAGKPIIGLRTSTHAFRYSRDKGSPHAKYDFASKAEGWNGGFGKKILGETWINHHGIHGKEGTRALVDGIAKRNDHPILKGVVDIWGPTDVYGLTDVPEGSEVLLWGQSTNGMTADAPVNWEKPIMPVAWAKTYKIENGNEGKVLATTMGASIDLLSEDLRRMIINGAYWAIDREDKIDEELNVEIVGDYNPTMFGFDQYKKGRKPEFYK
ncbi:ThuA domain-containing protein [Membranihabitans maritimus]|uniref:ThuA domain-containing protein n=1 Tax=Membranihabitans maritimus TaxID=2904244 RepID=UPI001F2B7C30|nr:ThuA domain-containing protein [Membranihabitans maritimus]